MAEEVGASIDEGRKLTGLGFLNNLPLWDGRSAFNLDIPQQLLKYFNNPQDLGRTIHVAGTNGKGTTCAFLGAILYAAGELPVGHYSSPHLVDVTERCIIDGVPISADDFNNSLLNVIDAARILDIKPSYFEYVTVAAFLEFARRKVNWKVVEVGLGGRLDATNVFKSPDVTIISSIDYDHTHILGNTLAEIAKEKAGICKSNVPLFVGSVSEEARNSILKTASNIGAPVFFLGKDFFLDYDEQVVSWGDKRLSLKTLTSNAPLLFGKHNLENAALAVSVAWHLGISDKEILKGLKTARWPGRVEFISDTQSQCGDFLLDAAHNEQGMRALMVGIKLILENHQQYRGITFYLSFLKTKEWQKLLQILSDFVKLNNYRCNFIFSRSDHHLCVSPEDCREEMGEGSVEPDIEAHLKRRQRAKNGKYESDELLHIVSGSIYFLGKVRPLLTKSMFCTITKN